MSITSNAHRSCRPHNSCAPSEDGVTYHLQYLRASLAPKLGAVPSGWEFRTSGDTQTTLSDHWKESSFPFSNKHRKPSLISTQSLFMLFFFFLKGARTNKHQLPKNQKIILPKSLDVDSAKNKSCPTCASCDRNTF